jgi:hypothetical protein
MTTQARDPVQRAPGLSVVPPGRQPDPVRPFKPSAYSNSLLCPSPETIPGTGQTVAAVTIFRGMGTAALTVSTEDASAVVRLTPDLARCLAWQLMDAADQIDAGGAK